MKTFFTLLIAALIFIIAPKLVVFAICILIIIIAMSALSFMLSDKSKTQKQVPSSPKQITYYSK